MAQETGTTILAHARVLAQDTSTSSPAVSDANALILLNGVLTRWGDVNAKETLVAASASGLTFAAGDAVKETSASDLWDHIVAAYESDANTVGTVLPPQLTHWTVEQMLAAHQNDFDGTVSSGGSSGWQAYAWEPVAGSDAKTGSTVLRVYVWPALAATRYMTLRVPKNMILDALTDTPDISRREAEVVKRLLAWEMARLHTEDTEFLQQILAPVPERILNAYFEGGKTHGWMQSSIRDTGALDG